MRCNTSSEYKPKLWLRYVDDIFPIWEHGREALEKLLSHLNSHRDSIKFSMEAEMNGCLPFLVVTIHKEGIKFLHLYIQKTNTYRSLPQLQLISPPKDQIRKK